MTKNKENPKNLEKFQYYKNFWQISKYFEKLEKYEILKNGRKEH
jgi:hypothetical protein